MFIIFILSQNCCLLEYCCQYE